MNGPKKIDFDALARAHKRLTDTPAPFEGGCSCGEVRYSCSAPPLWSANCHCRSCQQLTGSSFATAFTVKTEAFELIQGDVFSFERQSESGNRVTIVRCAKCGTWVFAKRAANPEYRNVLASTLDNPEDFVLISDVYVTEAAHWTVFDPKLTQFQKMPEDELPKKK